jgi:hypothetical protein
MRCLQVEIVYVFGQSESCRTRRVVLVVVVVVTSSYMWHYTFVFRVDDGDGRMGDHCKMFEL